jgi:hypothetical protein
MVDRVDRGEVRPWAVSWTGIWLGALAGVVAVVLFGFMGIALGAATTGDVTLRSMGFFGLVWAVAASFFAFVIAGWVSSSIAGSVTAEAGSLHGAGAFLLGMVLLLGLAAVGAHYVGGWYSAFVPATSGNAPSADAARNAAVAAAGAILIGLMGSVIGGWLASGEAMDWATATRRRVTSGR